MIPYFVVAAVFAAILLGAYRVLGGRPVGEESAAVWLTSALALIETAGGSLDAILAKEIPGTGVTDARAFATVAQRARGQLTGCRQCLDRLELPGDHPLQPAATAMGMAIDSYQWVCRMMSTEAFSDNPALVGSSRELAIEGRKRVDDAADAIEGVGSH